MNCVDCGKGCVMTLVVEGVHRCLRCWEEWRRPDKLGIIKLAADAPRPKKGDRMGKSLVTGDTYVATGEVIVRREPERSRAKSDVGSFDRHPNAPDDAPSERSGYFNGGVQYVPDEDGYW